MSKLNMTLACWNYDRTRAIQDGSIQPDGIDDDTVDFRETYNGEDHEPIVLPGFIDLHVHGGAGHDIMEGGDAALHVATLHARHGTTSMLGTTMTAPMEDLVVAMSAMTELCKQRAHGGARLLGVHLEGPYINEGRLGAQPPFARPVQSDELAALNALGFAKTRVVGNTVGQASAIKLCRSVMVKGLEALTAEMVKTQGRPEAATVHAFLSVGFEEKDVLYIVLAIAVKTLSNYCNHAFATPVDAVFSAYQVD